MQRRSALKKQPQSTSTLFKMLTRLFSGPMVNFRAQIPRELKRRQLDKYDRKFIDTDGKAFKRDLFSPFESVQMDYMYNQDRIGRYNDFRQMEFMPELSSALDIYSDEITTSSPMEPLLRIKSANQQIKSILYDLFYNRLAIESNLYFWARTCVKYGDFWLYLDLDPEMGIRSVIGLPSAEIERLEGLDDNNPNYVQFQWNARGFTFENWQVAHFRILGDDRYTPYGMSVLDPARRIFKQLSLLEEAMMAYRIVRAPEKKVFYIDVGGIHPDSVEAYIQQIQTAMKKNMIINSETGQTDVRYNIQSIEEDIWIPVRGTTSATKVDALPGGEFVGDIADVEYLRDKLFSAIKIPMSYLAHGTGASEDKSSLSQKDIVFARTIQRIQRNVVSELTKMAQIHLFILGYRGEDLIQFDLSLNNPSKIAELQVLESLKTKFDVAGAATEGFFSKGWVYKNVLALSEKEVLRIERERFRDAKVEALIAQIGGGAEGEGGGGGLDGDLGGDLGAGEPEPEDLGAEDGALGDEEGNDEEDILLAAPAKRSDELKPGDIYTTPGAKGKPYEKRRDQRQSGARKRNMMAKYDHEAASSAMRNLFGGYQGMQRVGKGILDEEQQSLLKDEEKQMFLLESESKALMEAVKEVNSQRKTLGKNKK